MTITVITRIEQTLISCLLFARHCSQHYFILQNNPMLESHYRHFTGEETEAPRCYVTVPRSHRKCADASTVHNMVSGRLYGFNKSSQNSLH